MPVQKKLNNSSKKSVDLFPVVLSITLLEVCRKVLFISRKGVKRAVDFPSYLQYFGDLSTRGS